MKRYLLAPIALGLSALLGATSYADVATVVPACNACHGPDGISPLPDVPTIAGISVIVFEDALYAYREGDRPCPTAPNPPEHPGAAGMDMCVHANGLAEEDVAGVAEHYAALPFVAATPQTDAGMAAQGKTIHDRDCEICHSQGGSDPTDDASILAGQQMGYLRHVLIEYQAGTRPQPRAMEAKLTALSATDIDALIHYYGSLQ